MNALNVEAFLNAYRDYELSQYHILDEIRKIRADFSHNKIYPRLAQLIDLYGTLKTITQAGSDLRNELPRRIAGLDLKGKRIIYEPIRLSSGNLQAIEDLINWALPHIQQAIEEGRTIYDFVDENLTMEGVGLLPSYVEEGYLLVPEHGRELLHVIRYEVTIFAGADQQYRNLKTTTIKTLPMPPVQASPHGIKLELIAEHRELPNPATYLCQTELDFPFQETILPVAKRKLLRRLYS